MKSIQMFSTESCSKCVKLHEFLEENSIPVEVRVIDTDPSARTDALMLKIMSAPALVDMETDVVLRQNQIFNKERINEEVVLSFVGE